MAGFQFFSSARIERQTVPEGKTLGWNRAGVNLPEQTSSPQARGAWLARDTHISAAWTGTLGLIGQQILSPCIRMGRTFRKLHAELVQTAVPDGLALGQTPDAFATKTALTPSLPGIPTSQIKRLSDESGPLVGFA